jgi:hypothetical protein
MSKKLIAVASAAALALTALVGVAPASANTGISYEGAAAGAGLTAAAPIVVNVPSQNVLRMVDSPSTSGSVVRVTVDSALTSNTIRVTATGAVKLLTTAQFTVTTNRTATFGSQALELTTTAADGLAGFYVYTTSTAVGTFTVVDNGNSTVRHIQGSNMAAFAYNVDFTAPATADVSGSIKLTGSITDVFGNKIEALTAAQTVDNTGTLAVTRFGAAGALSAVAADVWTESTTAKGTYTFSVLTTATPGAGVIGLSIPVIAITGLAAPKNTALFQFSTASLAEQVTALQARVTALTADLAALQIIKDRKVSKLKYNRLARKWNAAFPSNKVWVKP